MDKKDYLAQLEKALRNCHVADIDEILAEYDEHFERKTADGFSEAEIAAKLLRPELLAQQFVLEPQQQSRSGFWSRARIALLDTGVILLDVVLYPFVLVLAVAAVALPALSGAGFGSVMLDRLIPYIPLAGRLLLSTALLALAVLAGLATLYYTKMLNQLNAGYVQWRKPLPAGSLEFWHIWQWFV